MTETEKDAEIARLRDRLDKTDAEATMHARATDRGLAELASEKARAEKLERERDGAFSALREHIDSDPARLSDPLSLSQSYAELDAARTEVAALRERLSRVVGECDECVDLQELSDRADLAEAQVSALTKERDEARFRPLGDNHHNAAACPYCSPASEVARLTSQVEALRGALTELLLRAPASVFVLLSAWDHGVDPLVAGHFGRTRYDAALVAARAALSTLPAPQTKEDEP